MEQNFALRAAALQIYICIEFGSWLETNGNFRPSEASTTFLIVAAKGYIKKKKFKQNAATAWGPMAAPRPLIGLRAEAPTSLHGGECARRLQLRASGNGRSDLAPGGG
ncbi:hypothetical protein CRG98_032915 [Punica granatum]|uniref:Uncharacterized protein n=1 Tax=Punica granatum TaxID=22663 RepID=A0A2I0IS59_PUNGR|nr:hypothetical protein CRG98_032915 [Punica granatum]